MKPASEERDPISDPATRLALEHLAQSRQHLAGWAAQMTTRRSKGIGFGSFQPRSKTLRMLMPLALSHLPWMRWGATLLPSLLPLLLRFWRRR